MKEYVLYFATNRKHKGNNRWEPTGYGPDFSSDGRENLRFGKLTIEAEDQKVQKFKTKKIGFGKGDGEELAQYFLEQINTVKIKAFKENLDKKKQDFEQDPKSFGSKAAFNELRKKMAESNDVLVLIHGFNVSWEEAVATALSLQAMLNAKKNKVIVILFSWPSDGKALPLVSYKSDRTDAKDSGYSFGRGLLKLRDFLISLKNRQKVASIKNKISVSKIDCKQEIHLLCHSMGNYVLQNTIERMIEYNNGEVLPKIFDHIFLCAPDVDDDVLEAGQPLGKLHELARSISIYFNKGDMAMYVSDYTKGNPDRLGRAGAAKPSLMHNKIHQLDCSNIVDGLVEHSYYLSGNVNDDIRFSVEGVHQSNEQKRKRRKAGNAWPNVWEMTK